MYITCLDVEGVLVPEFGLLLLRQKRNSGAPKTTRDERIMISADELETWCSQRAQTWTERDPGDYCKDRSPSGSKGISR